MTVRLLMGKDINGMASTPFHEVPFGTTMFLPLDANVATTVGVPKNVDLVNFKYTQAAPADVWVQPNGIANISGSTSSYMLLETGDKLLLESGDALLLEGTGSYSPYLLGLTLNPISCSLAGITVLSFITTASNVIVNLNFYNRNSYGSI